MKEVFTYLAKRGVACAVIGAAFAATMASTALADSGDQSGQSTVANVAVESGITMTGLTPSFLLTGAPGQTVTNNSAVTFNVETNNVAGYSVTVQALSATMAPGDPVANTDVVSVVDLTVRETGSGTFAPLSSTTAVPVHSQSFRSETLGDSISNDYQLRIPVVNTDTYSVTLNYVATSF